MALSAWATIRPQDHDLVRFFVSSLGSARTITRSCTEVPLGDTTVTSSSTLPTSLFVSGRLISLRVITVEFPNVWVVTVPWGVGDAKVTTDDGVCGAEHWVKSKAEKQMRSAGVFFMGWNASYRHEVG